MRHAKGIGAEVLEEGTNTGRDARPDNQLSRGALLESHEDSTDEESGSSGKDNREVCSYGGDTDGDDTKIIIASTRPRRIAKDTAHLKMRYCKEICKQNSLV